MELVPTRRGFVAVAVAAVMVTMLFLATRAATGLDTVPTDLPNIVEPAGQAHGSDVPAIPNVQPIPTTTTAPATETTFSERLQERAESGGGEYLPAPSIGLDLDAPATTVAEVIANVVESTTTTVGADVRADATAGGVVGPECHSDEERGCIWPAETVDQSGDGITDDMSAGYSCVMPDGVTVYWETEAGRSGYTDMSDATDMIIPDPMYCDETVAAD